jgi:eukaryotic-like serine/threonine-protein kinase
MGSLLKSGQILHIHSSNQPCTVKGELGEGGQGEVYEVELGGRNYALKWYFPRYMQVDTSLRDRLNTAIALGSPSDRFLWPIDIVNLKGKSEFGYIMKLRGHEYLEMSKIYSKAPMTFKALATASFQLADSFLKLHVDKGMCYWDINYNNIFINPDTGDILICDNDNVTVYGAAETPIKGFPGFMAPEIVRNETTANCNTDLYSLSVLLFYLFMQHHPLKGKKEYEIRHDASEEAIAYQLYKLYASDPLFIFDPNDDSNRPVPGEHPRPLAYWSIYPKFLRDRFTQAFTIGLRNPSERVKESTWCETMLRLRDAIFYCSYCGAENFFDPASRPGETRCWNDACQQASTPYRLHIGKNSLVMLHLDTQLYPHHIDWGTPVNFSKPIAEISYKADNLEGQRYGLKNCSDLPWTATTARGAQRVDPGQSVMIKPGIRINFGKLEGEILL